jgi:hypothetical protein
MSYLGNFIPLDYLFLSLTFFTNIFICLITMLTFKYLFDTSNKSAYLIGVLVMTVDPFRMGGGGWLVDTYLKPASFVRVFSYFSLYFAIKNKILSTTIFIAIGSLFHPMIALETGLICYLLILVNNSYQLKTISSFSFFELFKKSYSLIFFATCLLIFILFFWLFPYGESKFLNNEAFLEIFLFRTFSDIVPSTFYFKGYIYAFIFSLFILIALKWYRINFNRPLVLNTIKTVSLFVLVFCIFGYMFVEIYPTRLWASAWTFRMLYIYKWLGMMLLAYVFTSIISRPIAANPIKLLYSKLVYYLKEGFHQSMPILLLNILLFSSILFISIPSLLAFTDHPGLCLFISIICLAWVLFVKNNYYKYIFPIAMVAVIFMDIMNPFLPLPNKIRKFYPQIKISYDIYDDAAKGVSDFARLKTDKDAVFVVPPNFGSFRYSSNRAIVVDRKCILFDDKGLLDWWNRINDCYGDIPKTSSYLSMNSQMISNYSLISKERILSLYEKYNAKYAVLFSETETDFEILYKDQNYKLVSIY